MTTYRDVPLSSVSWDEDDVDEGWTQLRFNIHDTFPVGGGGYITATITINDGKDKEQ